jgi:signal transduction histidine kinase
VSAALARPLTLDEVTRAVLGAALDASGADLASLGLVGADGATLRLVEASARTRGFAERSLPLFARDAIAVAAREGRALFIGSARDAATAPADVAAPSRGRAAAAVALVAAGRTLGAVGLRFASPHRFGAGERTFLLGLAQQLAAAIERHRLHEAERVARAAAEANSRVKNEFLATISHEIRTPLNAIVGYAELLEMRLAGPVTETQQSYLDRIRASSAHLLAIVNDMLDLAKVEAGRLLVSSGDASAREVIRAALAIVHPQAIARGVALLGRCDAESDVRYQGDPRRVEQVVLNLLSNAVRFTESGGRVTAGCRLADAPTFAPRPDHPAHRWCAIDVEDTGIGIAPEHLAAIFDPFTQVESGHTRTRGGSGLGLAISRRLARLMDGDVTVESRIGVGSIFTLWLPGAAEPPARQVAATPPRRAERAPGLLEVGDAVLSDLEGIIGRYMARVRADPKMPSARGIDASDLENHTATFVTDIAQALAILEEKGAGSSQVQRHDSEIQHLIADRHGELRRQLGWSQSELERDIEILWEEVEAAVRRAIPSDEPAVTDGLLELKKFFDRAFEVSRQAYRREARAPRDA